MSLLRALPVAVVAAIATSPAAPRATVEGPTSPAVAAAPVAAAPAAPSGALAYVVETPAGRRVEVKDLGAGTTTRLSLHGDGYPGPRAADGSSLVVTSTPQGERLHRRDGASLEAIGAGRFRRPVHWPGHGWVAEGGHRERPTLVLVATGDTVARCPSGCFAPHASADGKLAYVDSRDGQSAVVTLDAPGASPRRVTWGAGHVASPRWSPNGARLAFVRRRGATQDLVVSGARGQRPRTIPLDGLVDRPRWSPDGDRLVVERRSAGALGLAIVDVASGALVASAHEPAPAAQPAWSPDGAWIAFTAGEGHDSRVVLWHPASDTRRPVSAAGDGAWLPRFW